MSNHFWIQTLDGETIFGTGGRGFHRLMLIIDRNSTEQEWEAVQPFGEDVRMNLDAWWRDEK